MSSQYPLHSCPYNPRPTSVGNTSRSIETFVPAGGIPSSTLRSMMYAPALIRLVSAWSGLGFSTNAVTAPSSSRRTSPYADGSATGTSASVTRALVRSCASSCAVRSRSVRVSPLSMKKRSSSRSSANLSAPPVPSGRGSSR